MAVHVMKLGGSLLDLPDLKLRLARQVEELPAAQTWLVVGGGQVVEEIRRLDALHKLETCFTHWHCVDLLGTTARYAAKLLELPLVENQDDFRAARNAEEPHLLVVDVRCFYARPQGEASGDGEPGAAHVLGQLPQLPEDWSTTSDAIAGLLAILLDADRLILLKSVEQPQGDVKQWARLGVVDDVLADLQAQIPRIEINNLRASAHDQ